MKNLPKKSLPFWTHHVLQRRKKRVKLDQFLVTIFSYIFRKFSRFFIFDYRIRISITSQSFEQIIVFLPPKLPNMKIVHYTPACCLEPYIDSIWMQCNLWIQNRLSFLIIAHSKFWTDLHFFYRNQNFYQIFILEMIGIFYVNKTFFTFFRKSSISQLLLTYRQKPSFWDFLP